MSRRKLSDTEEVDTTTGEVIEVDSTSIKTKKKKKNEEPEVEEGGNILSKLASKVSLNFLNNPDQDSKVDKFISTGSTLLDLALNGGWAVGRAVNIVGDESTGKSLLAGEAIASTQRKFKGIGVYDDAESTFESTRAEVLGIKAEETLTPNSATVEDFFEKTEQLCDELVKVKNAPIVTYVLDSMDAISTEAELDREIGQATFGADKAKRMSEFFRRLTKKMSKVDMTLIIISQTRDKIGVMFGDKKGTSGGKALKFYASQRVMLSEIGKVKANDKIIGIKVKARVIKNKVGRPFGEVSFDILFNYGIDDIESCVTWLYDNTDALGTTQGYYTWKDKKFRKNELINYIEDNNLEEDLKDAVKVEWKSIESETIVRKKKYD